MKWKTNFRARYATNVNTDIYLMVVANRRMVHTSIHEYFLNNINFTKHSYPENPIILQILIQILKTETDIKHIGYILFINLQSLPTSTITCYNTITMKNETTTIKLKYLIRNTYVPKLARSNKGL